MWEHSFFGYDLTQWWASRQHRKYAENLLNAKAWDCNSPSSSWACIQTTKERKAPICAILVCPEGQVLCGPPTKDQTFLLANMCHYAKPTTTRSTKPLHEASSEHEWRWCRPSMPVAVSTPLALSLFCRHIMAHLLTVWLCQVLFFTKQMHFKS